MKEADILSLARENIRKLKPYSSARDDFKGKARVFLDANENPLQSDFNRYPDPHQHLLKDAIGKLKNVPVNTIFIGNGSDEAIDLLFRVFCEPGRDNVIIPEPTYGMYAVSAAVNDTHVISTQLAPDFGLNARQVLQAVTAQTKIVFLCSPNNPSGNLLPRTEVEYLIKHFQGIVVIDEAYVDFAGVAGWLPGFKEFPNLVVLQTFSKAWGLAGLRLGVCFASAMIVGLLDKIKPPYNIGSFAQSYLLKQIHSGRENVKHAVETIISERKWLQHQFSLVHSVKKVHPSHANFLLVEFLNSSVVFNHLTSQGIIVRDRSGAVNCSNCLRITVGTREENIKLIEALKEYEATIAN
jgi:histidinol-phosphate aminotransferase